MIDVMRSSGVFNPGKFKDDIHIIGVGATGSHVCEGLILQGINGSQINVYDFDIVEEHNIANQIYTYEDIGKPKVEALAFNIKNRYGENIKIHNAKVESAGEFKGVVYLLIDSSRETLFKSMKFKTGINLLIETGLDARAGRCVTIDPRNIKHVKYFESRYLFPDDTVDSGEVSVCGTRQVVANTVKILASIAVWDFMKWVNTESIGKDVYFSTDPWFITEDIIK
ncbi:MAG: ThiF family adenylyltransferase [Vicingus serpentipes]|nr:ThiF family adenylyltransferase [Vicingus serpentipes]